METLLDRHWHHMPSSEVLDLLESDQEKGLDIFEVEHRLERFGPNVLTERKGQGLLVRFLLQFNQPLVYILLAAVFITAILQEWADSGVILGVVLVNAVIGFLQESKALKAIEALASSMTSEATVLRAGEKNGFLQRIWCPAMLCSCAQVTKSQPICDSLALANFRLMSPP